MKLRILCCAATAIAMNMAGGLAWAQEKSDGASASVETAKPKASVPPVVHSAVGDRSDGYGERLRMVNVGKRQQFSGAMKESFDTDISSPKSVTFNSDGSRLYINSLEGCRTVVYRSPSLEKEKVINYDFPSGQGNLWASPSGYYPFTHYDNGASRAFSGKPVESAWTHDFRYLWVPFYRRTFDLNAQDPSAMAVIDTRTHEIVRMFETGPLPKVVATAPDNSVILIAHWGDNTVGMIDISSDNPKDWKHLPPIEVGSKLKLNYSLTTPVNRDTNSGYLLRGTIFTPDSRYAMVAGLAGPMAVIDVKNHKLLGTVGEIYGVRHLVLKNGMVYGSRNVAGEVLSFSLADLIAGIEEAATSGQSKISVKGPVRRVGVGGGARTLEASPDGKYLFVACNSASAVYVVEAEQMKVVDRIRCDSYPVGLAISPDGRYMAVTSQGRQGNGGNAVNLFEIIRTDVDSTALVISAPADTATVDTATVATTANTSTGKSSSTRPWWWLIVAFIAGFAAVATIIFTRRRSSKLQR